ncbi:uncharacterized protein LOC123694745 isoform X2 [Colias croceus]|uniref:uncharacterized protein LOC123694745 isoform X2 n=1 Tax=Colias crocea TaxID=72248 RepID=UPI001E27E437|nr:uncharacterized protein LOC123694745 isoform X2 [Colias croceus]
MNNLHVYIGRDKTTKWSSKPPQPNDKPKTENAIQNVGVQFLARSANTEIECWRHFITDGMLEHIVCHTNAKIKQKILANCKQTRENTTKEKETTKDELLAFLGLLYLAGLNNSKRQDLHDFWRTDGTGVEVFRSTMSMQRFYFLHSCLRFGDSSPEKVKFMCSRDGESLMKLGDFTFTRLWRTGTKWCWSCYTHNDHGCEATAYTERNRLVFARNHHNHPPTEFFV